MAISNKERKLTKIQLRSSYITTIISISLLLFMLGLVGLLLLNSKKMSNYVKENIKISVILKADSKEPDILKLRKTFDASPYVRSTKFITKEEAAKTFQEELGEDFITALGGDNPLLPEIDVYLYAQYANNDSIKSIVRLFDKDPSIQEIYYQKDLIQQVNDNIKNISFIILIVSVLLFIISLTLINNTIRLSIYSKRFIINSMKLVGATNNFILKPFIINSFFHGIYSALVANGFIIAFVYFIQKQLNYLVNLFNVYELVFLFICILILGIIINTFFTFIAVKKYLRLKSEDLYF